MTTFVTSANSPENLYYVKSTTLCSLMHCTAAHFASRHLPIIILLRDGHWPSAFHR